MGAWLRWAYRMTSAGLWAAVLATMLAAAANARDTVVRGRPEPIDDGVVICFTEQAVQEFVSRYRETIKHPSELSAGCTLGKTGAQVVVYAKLPGMKLSVRELRDRDEGEKCPDPERPGYFWYCKTVIYGWFVGRMRELGRQDVPVYVRALDSIILIDP
jgi:hypothetical protein